MTVAWLSPLGRRTRSGLRGVTRMDCGIVLWGWGSVAFKLGRSAYIVLSAGVWHFRAEEWWTEHSHGARCNSLAQMPLGDQGWPTCRPAVIHFMCSIRHPTLPLEPTSLRDSVWRQMFSVWKFLTNSGTYPINGYLFKIWLSCSRFIASVSLPCTEREDRWVFQWLVVLDLMLADASLISCWAYGRSTIEDWAEWRMLTASFGCVSHLPRRMC